MLCDWGSSRLRAFLEIEGAIADRRDGPGIHRLGAESPAQALSAVLASWRSGPLPEVFLCGMAGSRNGLAEVPYVRAPVTMEAWRRGRLRVRIGDLDATIASGVQANNFLGVPDVMRGEETQIFGALALDRQLAAGNHLIVLPGTHSKWVQVRDGAIERVQTYITGELFDLLGRHSSLLRVGADIGADDEGLNAGMRAGVRGDLAASLFETRAAQLIDGRSAGWGRAFLSGLLIGAEIASMLGTGELRSAPLTVIGEPELTAIYLQTLASHQLRTQALDGERCVCEGLRILADAEQES